MRSPISTTVMTFWVLMQLYLIVLTSSEIAAEAADTDYDRDITESRPTHRIIMNLLEFIHDQESNPPPKDHARLRLQRTLEVENEEDSEGTEEEQHVRKGSRLDYIAPEEKKVQKSSYSDEKRFYSDW